MAELNRLMGSKLSLFSINYSRNKYLQFLSLNDGYYKVRVALIQQVLKVRIGRLTIIVLILDI